ncbi:toll/interleukin-1 receptor domain-containing protein [bacterium]|nr:toll/interleukin-1 receptor domain-containing protein [bacterium]
MSAPRAFLCHSSKDKPFVEALAEHLMAHGVEVWFDKWDIQPGDSLRRKIEEGIESSGFFIPVLSENSLESEWVKTELDAATILKLQGSCRIVPVLRGVTVDQVPLTLRSMACVTGSTDQDRMEMVLNVCHGFSVKPPLGDRPQREAVENTKLSPNASTLARKVAAADEFGCSGLSYCDLSEIKAEVGLSDTEIMEALDELQDEAMIEIHRSLSGIHGFMPQNMLFWKVDNSVMGWDPIKDADTVAVLLFNSSDVSYDAPSIAAQLGWSARRLNPALTLLSTHDLIDARPTMGSAPFAFHFLGKTHKLNRVVRQGMSQD